MSPQHAWGNLLQVALDELGKVTVKEIHAFLFLRQSSLTTEDKKRVLTMTGGAMETARVEQAMRTLATTVLPAEPEKKVYPTNFVETENVNVATDDDNQVHHAYYAHGDEDDALSDEQLDRSLAKDRAEGFDDHRLQVSL